MKVLYLLAMGLAPVLAFPAVMNEMMADPKVRRAANPAVAASQAEGNCGPIPCRTFNAKEQYVSTSGEHAYQSPGPSDIRGPCPGLNAAANHGYLPRNGILDVESTVNGLSDAYGFGDEFSFALNAFSSIVSGDILTETWTIGGPQPNVIAPFGYPPQGISYSHNKYEGDVSIVRNDAYMNHGDAHSANATKFTMAIASGRDNNRYTLDKFRKLFEQNQKDSIANNPRFFSPFLSTTAVSPAAYNFVINFMSNHSAAEPNGYLDEYNFKTFFAMEGTYPHYTWKPGQERIPENWYRRPKSNPYDSAAFAADLVIQWAAYPDTFKIGGNTNGVNTYQGVDLGKLTGGTYDFSGLLKGNNAACFFFQAMQAAIPDDIKGGINQLNGALALFDKAIGGPILSKLSCPQLAKYDTTLFNSFPGRTYSPTGPDTNYKA